MATLPERTLEAGTALLALGVPLAFGTRLADAVVIPKSAVFLAGSSLVLAAWWTGAARGLWPLLHRGKLAWLGGALGAWSALTALLGDGGVLARGPALEHLTGALVLQAWVACGSPERWRRWWTWWMVSGCVVVLYAWLQRLGLDPFAWNLPHLSRERTISTLGNPNYLALFLVGWLPVALAWLTRMEGAKRAAGFLGWALAWTAMVLTTTRGAWIAFAAGCLAWAVGGALTAAIRRPAM
ncbi:MAG: hypothetical protein AB1758_28650, partial [Candidatus Eremiobacterota bacterium]